MEQVPSITPIEYKFILWTLAALFGLLIAVIAFFGKLIVAYLKSMAKSMAKMETDLSVLANDHTNLKEDHRELKGRVSTIEQRIKYNGQAN